MKLFEKHSFRIGVQLAFWLCLLCNMSLLFLWFQATNAFIWRNVMLFLSIAAIIFGNVYYCFPQFFARKDYGAFGIAITLLIGGLFLATNYLDSVFLRDIPPPKVFSKEMFNKMPGAPNHSFFKFPAYVLKTSIFFAATMASTVLESIRLHQQQEQMASLMRQEKLETEMKFLKNQINPHFLFNVLNNVYGLSLKKSEQTPEVVMQLSEMLRYMLYDSNKALVPLKKEIQYLENYIALQQLKSEKELVLTTQFEISRKQPRIAPLLLIPFVENAFKHSKIEDLKNGWISITLKTTEELIELQVTNSIPQRPYTKDACGGIGLTNVKRRLELEYPNRHELVINKSTTQFAINLKIDLQ